MDCRRNIVFDSGGFQNIPCDQLTDTTIWLVQVGGLEDDVVVARIEGYMNDSMNIPGLYDRES
jgi:hypothetical protein